MDVTAIVVSVIGVLGVCSGIILGWTGRGREVKKETKEEAIDGAKLRADVEYIRSGVDDIRLEQKAQAKKVDALAERVTRVEESSKSAHHRLDELAKK